MGTRISATRPSNYFVVRKVSIEKGNMHRSKQRSTYCRSPLNSHTVEHVSGKQRKHTAKETSHERIGRDGGCSEHEIGVDNVVQERQKDGEDAKADEQTTENGRDPKNTSSVARPTKPKKTAYLVISIYE